MIDRFQWICVFGLLGALSESEACSASVLTPNGVTDLASESQYRQRSIPQKDESLFLKNFKHPKSSESLDSFKNRQNSKNSVKFAKIEKQKSPKHALPTPIQVKNSIDHDDIGMDVHGLFDTSILGGNARVENPIRGPTAGGNSPILQPQDLNCFNWDGTCRWRNEPNGIGRDQLDWGRASGQWGQTQGLYAFGTDVQPDQPYWAITGSARLLPASDTAMLVSDPLSCQVGDGEVSMKYWISRGGSVRVCTRRPNGGNNYLYCSPAVSNGDPGPMVITIPGQLWAREPFEIVIEARGFTFNEVGREGGVMVIDNVQYTSASVNPSSCPRRQEEETTPAKDPNEEVCQAVACDFDAGCTSTWMRSNSGWRTQQGGPVGNLHTGIRSPLEGSYAYAQGPTTSRGNAVMRSEPFELVEDKLLRLCYYRPSANSNLIINAVIDGRPNRVFNSQELTSRVEPHQWRCDAEVLLGAQFYDSIEIVADGLQTQYSYLAVDKIEIFDIIDDQFPVCS